ncbi:4-oxalocrotonate tautomerase [Gluconacetobacter sacchari DSM 12717]|uniref:Tautomerase family protein n=2 Tax=Gluconacetobacter sacchari TaxID=92759 RepID=A0A7W4IF90_9PROT|nr:tautomerase family protein [Gluconacetobacter sacchari]MBB2161806.1 tautomerase family protein [Gluconacetobacter sacchari]GBQ20195.1 4-oxalocrotonate tautomerase [Gluconacetobacter sacchari DSM 12717]
MPFLNIHVVKGRSEEQTTILLQTIHDAMVDAFKVPVRDRYQILNEHESRLLIMEDTGLGFVRSDKRVLIHVTTRPRPQEMKERFYVLLVEGLGRHCGIKPEDIMVSCIENNDSDWSFGLGRAQFLVGDL